MRDLVKKVSLENGYISIQNFSIQDIQESQILFQIVNTSRTYTVDKDKIARMVEKYVSRYTTSAPPSDRKRK